MSDFSLFGETELIQHGFVVASVSGTPIIADASTNTKGAYVEIVSAANNITDSSAITVIISSEGATAAGFLIDISIGGAGSEEVIISNILFNTTSVAIQTSDKVKIPINIPAGQIISIRCQSQSSSATIPVYIKLAPSNFKQPESCSEVVSIGANESATRGVEVAANTVTFGSWVEITSSLSLDIKGFFISTQKGVVASWSNLVVSYQVALGSVGN